MPVYKNSCMDCGTFSFNDSELSECLRCGGSNMIHTEEK